MFINPYCCGPICYFFGLFFVVSFRFSVSLWPTIKIPPHEFSLRSFLVA